MINMDMNKNRIKREMDQQMKQNEIQISCKWKEMKA